MKKPGRGIRRMVGEYLIDNGFDGLCSPHGDCECLVSELKDCDEFKDCLAGYKKKCESVCPWRPQEECKGYHIVKQKPQESKV